MLYAFFTRVGRLAAYPKRRRLLPGFVRHHHDYVPLYTRASGSVQQRCDDIVTAVHAVHSVPADAPSGQSFSLRKATDFVTATRDGCDGSANVFSTQRKMFLHIFCLKCLPTILAVLNFALIIFRFKVAGRFSRSSDSFETFYISCLAAPSLYGASFILRGAFGNVELRRGAFSVSEKRKMSIYMADFS